MFFPWNNSIKLFFQVNYYALVFSWKSHVIGYLPQNLSRFKFIIYFLWLSFRWFNFEKVVEALVAKNIYHMNLEQLQTHAKEVCFIEDEDQFHIMLNFYHDLGMIVKHRSTVILKAQWLIDLFKKLITIPPFDKAVGRLKAWHFLHLL